MSLLPIILFGKIRESDLCKCGKEKFKDQKMCADCFWKKENKKLKGEKINDRRSK